MLDLGKVSATCEIKVNGQAVGVRMSPPYNADITPYLKGETRIDEGLKEIYHQENKIYSYPENILNDNYKGMEK